MSNINYQDLHILYKNETGSDRPFGREIPKQYFAPGILDYLEWLEDKVTEYLDEKARKDRERLEEEVEEYLNEKARKSSE